MLRRLATLLGAYLSCSLVFAASALAQAPASAATAADREAARNLYMEGFALQQAGNFADALERFKRAEAVYPAPTTQLHIAECDAQLGRLVEAAETYRALTRQQLPPGAPAAFVAAQTQAAAELQQVEPRIPHLRLDVTPHGIADLAISIDDQPLNLALLDVDRPVDPGSHRIVATAPGYFRAEATVVVREKETSKAVVIPMRASGGAVAPVAPAPAVALVVTPPAAPPPAPSPDLPVYVPEYHSATGLFVGPRVGGILLTGSDAVTNLAGGGFALGAEVDLRFARRLFIGGVVDHGFLSGGSISSGTSIPGLGNVLPAVGTSASTTNLAGTFGVVVNPDRVSALFQVGVGYRWMTVSSSVASATLTSIEGMFGGGIWIPIGHSVRLVPRLDLGFGSFGVPAGLTGGDSSSQSSYLFANFNLAGYFNLDFGHPPPKT